MDEFGWFAVLSSHEVARGKVVAARRLGRELAFWRDHDGAVHAVEDSCPHRRTKLSLGKVTQDGCLECPFHGFRFDAAGECTLIPVHGEGGPIPKAMHTPALAVREENGFVFVWGDRTCEPVGDPPWFPHLKEGRWSHGELIAEWDTHYSRAVENQLDFAHLPFVHETTIGRGMAKEMKAITEVGEGFIRGRAVVGGASPDAHSWLEWREPNLWVLHIAERYSIVVAFAPIDEEHTRMYLRSYQSFVTVPVLRHVVDLIGKVGNRRVLEQDRRVVEAQRPKETSLRMEELLVPSDSHIIAFRRVRERRRREREERRPGQLVALHPGKRRSHGA